MTDWIRTFGAWAPAMPGARSILAGYTAAAERLELELAAAGAEALEPIDFRVIERGVTFGDPELDGPPIALLAEVRAIVLRHPNPFPELRLLWPWRRSPLVPVTPDP